MKPKAIVLRTAGTNCDHESKSALELAGFEAERVHINKLIRKEISLENYHLAMIPGGFADGDYLGSAKILANKIRFRLENEFPDFVKDGKLILGVCNGFQALVKSGMLPALNNEYTKQTATITFNDSGHFQCEWVNLKNVNKGKCIFTKGISELYVPIAHGEGKFDPGADEFLKKMYDDDQIVFKYANNPNGSIDDIAGLCDPTGRVFGLMPHPERNISYLNDPRYFRKKPEKEEGAGMQIFRNAFEYVQENLI
ncbi:MAG: phosphoribosylformylglycinamidine synthase I [Candidatus Diapherotrites archaeon]